jgi:hypothetical protein
MALQNLIISQAVSKQSLATTSLVSGTLLAFYTDACLAVCHFGRADGAA